ncbi:MAG: inositol phosphate phosphatase SopB [Candidatus Margulisiibacteriota bacterium]
MSEFKGLSTVARKLTDVPHKSEQVISAAAQSRIKGLLGDHVHSVTMASKEQKAFVLNWFQRFVFFLIKHIFSAHFTKKLKEIRFADLNLSAQARLQISTLPRRYPMMSSATKAAHQTQIETTKAKLTPQLERRNLQAAIMAKKEKLNALFVNLLLARFKEELDTVLIQEDVSKAKEIFSHILAKYRGQYDNGPTIDPVTTALIDFNFVVEHAGNVKAIREAVNAQNGLISTLDALVREDLSRAELNDPFLILGLDRAEGHAYYYTQNDIKSAYEKQRDAILSELEAGNIIQSEHDVLLQILNFAYHEVQNPLLRENWLHYFNHEEFTEIPTEVDSQLLTALDTANERLQLVTLLPEETPLVRLQNAFRDLQDDLIDNQTDLSEQISIIKELINGSYTAMIVDVDDDILLNSSYHFYNPELGGNLMGLLENIQQAIESGTPIDLRELAGIPDLLAADAKNLETAFFLQRVSSLISHQPPIENNQEIRNYLSQIRTNLDELRGVLTQTDLALELREIAQNLEHILLEQFNLYSDYLHNNPLTETAVYQYCARWDQAGEIFCDELAAKIPPDTPRSKAIEREIIDFKAMIRARRSEFLKHDDTKELSKEEIKALFVNEEIFLEKSLSLFLKRCPEIKFDLKRGLKYTSDLIKPRLNKAFTQVLNGESWQLIEADLPLKFQDGVENLHITQKPTNSGVCALATKEVSQSINTWDYAADGENGPAISGIRHGVHCAYGLTSKYLAALTDTELTGLINDLLFSENKIPDPDFIASVNDLLPVGSRDIKSICENIRVDQEFCHSALAIMRRQANFNRALDWGKAALLNHIARQPQVWEQIAAGQPIDLTIMEMSLLTPDVFRHCFKHGHASDERMLLEEQAQAYQDILAYFRDPNHKVTIKNQDGAEHHVSLDLKIINFNFGVNSGAFNFGLAKSYQEENFNEKSFGFLKERVAGVLQSLNQEIMIQPENQSLSQLKVLIETLWQQITNLYDAYKKSVSAGVEPFKLTIRIGYLAYLLGMVPSHHCKDGTDRTSQYLAELVNLAATVSHDFVRGMVFVPQPEHPYDANLSRIILGMGNHQVQAHNFGVSGYKSVLSESGKRVGSMALQRQTGLSDFRPHV